MIGTLTTTTATAIYFMSSMVAGFMGGDQYDGTLRIDSAHNAILEISQNTGDKSLIGTIKGGVDASEGISFIDMKVNLDSKKRFKDTDIHFYGLPAPDPLYDMLLKKTQNFYLKRR